MDVGVVVPLFNGAQWIGGTLDAVALALEEVDGRVVVVDDGSHDGGGDLVLTSYPNVEVVRQPNSGVASARNRGAVAHGQVPDSLLFLDQDDLLTTTGIRALVRALHVAPGCDAVVGGARFVSGDGGVHPVDAGELMRERRRVVGRRTRCDTRDVVDATTFAYRNCIYTPGQVLLRRSAFERAGGFDARFAPNDDWDLWLRVSATHPLRVVDTHVIDVRRHSQNVSSDVRLMRRREIDLRSDALKRGDGDTSRLIASGYRASELRRSADLLAVAGRRQVDGSGSPHRAKLLARAGAAVLSSVGGLRMRCRVDRTVRNMRG